MTIGEKIFGLRKKLGISQEELAQQLDVSRQAISKWERDEAIPDTDKIVALSSVFSISTDYLLLDQLEKNEEGPAAAPPLKKRRKALAGGIVLGIGLLMGLTSTLALLVWKNVLSGSVAGPPPNMLPVFNVMGAIIKIAPLVSIGLVVAGILLLLINRREGRRK